MIFLLLCLDLSFGPSTVEWFKKAKRVCRLCKVKEPALVIPLRLTKRAYAVYQQLGDDAGLEEIKLALYAAFGVDPFVAWRRFTEWRWDSGCLPGQSKEAGCAVPWHERPHTGMHFSGGFPGQRQSATASIFEAQWARAGRIAGQSPEHLKRRYRTDLGSSGSTPTNNRGPKMLQMWWTQPLLSGLPKLEQYEGHTWSKSTDMNTLPLLRQARLHSTGPVLDFGPERGPGKGTMADLGPLIRHLVSTRLPSSGRAAFLSPLSPLYGTRPCV